MKSSMKIKRQVEEMKLIKGNLPCMFHVYTWKTYNFLNELPNSILGVVDLDSRKQLSLKD